MKNNHSLIKMNYYNFGKELVKAVPELREFYNENLEYYREELLHGFMGDVFCYVSKSVGLFVPKWIDVLFEFLDKAIKSVDGRVDNVICVSFLENLMIKTYVLDRTDRVLRSRLGPNLKKELEKMDNWRPDPSRRVNVKRRNKMLKDLSKIKNILMERTLVDDIETILESHKIKFDKKEYYMPEEKAALVEKLTKKLSKEQILYELKRLEDK